MEGEGGVNPYGFVGNNPINQIDPLGLAITAGTLSDTEEALAIGATLEYGLGAAAIISYKNLQRAVSSWNDMQTAVWTTATSAADDGMDEDLQALNISLAGQLANTANLQPEEPPGKGLGKKKSGEQRKNLEGLRNFYKSKLNGKQVERFKEIIERGKVGEQYSTKEALKRAYEEANRLAP